MEDLVFVKYNQALIKRFSIRDQIDPISLNDIDDCNEWMVGEYHEEEDAGNELVFEGDEDLNWEVVFRASGVGEPTTNTRQQSKKRKATSGGGESSGGAKAIVSRKGKEKTIVNEELEMEEMEDTEEEEEEIKFDDSDSGEEKEAYVHNDDFIGDED